MLIDFCGGAYKTFSTNLNAQECVNFFTHIDQDGATSQLSLRATPGLKEWCDTDNYAEVRGGHVFETYLYVVVGDTVYRVDSEGESTACDGVLSTTTGSVSMDHNPTQLMIVDGEYGYIVTGAVVTKITDVDFPDNPTTVTYQDGYFLVSVEYSGLVYISDLSDGTSWDGTMSFNAEGYPDNVLAVLSDHRDLIAFGEETIEVWYNSGATVPFDRKPGLYQEIGLGARFSPVQLDNTVFYLTNKYQVAKLQGSNSVAVSTRAIEHQISQYEVKDDAVGMGINIEGNSFYVITFPSANATWMFNVATGFWNQLVSDLYYRWRGNCYAMFAGKHIVGDYENGKLYELDFETYKDNGEIIRRIRTAPAIKNEGKIIFHYMLEVFIEAGVGLAVGQGSDPMIMMEFSDDGGHTWGSEIWRSAGKIGKYKWRAVWNRLGYSRQRNYRLIVTDPVKWVITGANLEATVGAS